MTREYPTNRTALSELRHVTDDEIERDIAVTLKEIDSLVKESQAHKLLAVAKVGTAAGKIAFFLHRAKEVEIKDRRKFVRFLRALLDARTANGDVEGSLT